MTQQRLAEGAGVTMPTIRRLEAGDPGVSLATLAMVLVVLGEGSRLANLLDTGTDDVGLLLENEKLPQRVRTARGKRVSTDEGHGEGRGNDTNDGFGEAF
jgi:transcriptional regulator with XRE-family HTH domain